MKNLKRFSIFLLVFMLGIGMMTIPVFAASTSQDKIEVTLTADKESYGQDDRIVSNLTVKNTNDTAVSNISLESLTPKGYKLAEGSKATKQVESLGAGETVSLSVTYAVPASPPTGDTSHICLWGAILLVAVCGLFIFAPFRKRRGRRFLSLILSLAMLCSLTAGLSFAANAEDCADNAEKEIAIAETITVAGKGLELKAIVRYQSLEPPSECASSSGDPDKDGLIDSLEVSMGTDPNNPDTDGDGVSDYNELNWLNYNPLVDDTDGNGVLDKDEDTDNDGLTNGYEDKLGTNPAYYDTDYDKLSDGDEVNIYHTNPLLADTDEDGVSDKTEVSIGSDPLVAETCFTTKADGPDVSEITPITASASVISGAAGAGSLEINEITSFDNFYVSPSIPGYLGAAYEFDFNGGFESATITFKYDTALGEIGDLFQPRIYYLHDDGTLEEVKNQTVEDGVISAEVEHFSTYILLNKIEFDIVWDKEIRIPDTQETQMTGLDVVFVIDSSGSMDWNDSSNLRKVAAKKFVDKLGDKDRAAVVDFDDSAELLQNLTSDHDLLYNAIEKIDNSGGTSLSEGINEAIEQFIDEYYTSTDKYKYVIFLTDGVGDYSESYTSAAADNNIVIYTIGLGSGVQESVLKGIAEGTGGKYYFATGAEQIPDIYANVSFETVDYTTDSNNDGICDYYTALINAGKLLLSNGTPLAGVTDMYGEDCDDWDGDGLKNGEEITIEEKEGNVYLKMLSHPMLVDTDSDGYSDYDEIVKMKTPPMKTTKSGSRHLNGLISGDDYVYVDSVESTGLKGFTRDFAKYGFDWHKTDESKEKIINYFADYASSNSIQANADAIAKQAKRQKALDVVSTALDLVKALKSVADTITEAGSDPKKVEELISKCNGANKDTLKSLNEEEEKKIETTIHKLKVMKEVAELGDQICKDFSLSHPDTTEKWSAGAKTFGAVATTVGAIVKRVRDANESWQFPMKKTMTNFSNKYQTTMGAKPLGIKNATVISIAFDVADTAVDIAEIANTYGKLKANAEAFNEYVEVLQYMSENCDQNYVRNASGDVLRIVLDTSWNEYYKQLVEQSGKTVAITVIKDACKIGGEFCPYVKIAVLICEVVKAAMDFTGITEAAKWVVQSEVIYGISNGCINCLNPLITIDDLFYSYEENDAENVQKYMTQLAQSRIVGEYDVREELKKASVGHWLHKRIDKTNNEEIDEMFNTLIGAIYTKANRLNLILSEKLPLYNGAISGGGSGGGGGNSWDNGSISGGGGSW